VEAGRGLGEELKEQAERHDGGGGAGEAKKIAKSWEGKTEGDKRIGQGGYG
jgi:hypothetical protein